MKGVLSLPGSDCGVEKLASKGKRNASSNSIVV